MFKKKNNKLNNNLLKTGELYEITHAEVMTKSVFRSDNKFLLFCLNESKKRVLDGHDFTFIDDDSCFYINEKIPLLYLGESFIKRIAVPHSNLNLLRIPAEVNSFPRNSKKLDKNSSKLWKIGLCQCGSIGSQSVISITMLLEKFLYKDKIVYVPFPQCLKCNPLMSLNSNVLDVEISNYFRKVNL